MPDGYLAFADAFRAPIIAGEKTHTLRYGFDRDLGAGDEIELRDEAGTQFARARVSRVEEVTPREYVARDPDGHASYADVDELAASMTEYYPDADIGAETPLTAIWFEDVTPTG